MPAALNNRPNLITKEALVDQAFALSKYAVDSLEKFDLEFPKQDTTLSSAEKDGFDAVTRERIFLYQAHREHETEKLSSLPPENLVAGLRKLYEGKVRQLLEAVKDHAVFQGNSTDSPRNLETLICSVVKLVTDPNDSKGSQARLQGLMIAILSLLPTNSYDAANPKRAAAPREGATSPHLTVGPLLALLDPGSELLSYFGTAAAVFEERSEILTARRLARMDTESDEARADSTSPTMPEAEPIPAIPVDSFDSVADEPNVIDDDEEEVDLEEEDEEDDDDEDDDDDEEEEDDSEYTEEDDDDVVMEPEQGGDVFDTDDDEEEEVAQGIHRSLSVSVTNTSTPARSPSPEESPEDNESRAENEQDDDDKKDDDEESSLPPLPQPPRDANMEDYILGGKLSQLTSDDDLKDSPSMELPPLLDPSDFSEFARVPKFLVLQVLLLAAEKLVLKLRFPSYSPEAKNEIFPGGMGALLFREEKKDVEEKTSNSELTFQLLVAAFLLIEERRFDAIENLRKALARELRLGQGGDFSDDDLSHSDSGSGQPPTSGEADDPALTLAMNYIEDDVPLSSESLENKGMRRKAAAAAHELSVMIETSRKHTDTCRKDLQRASHLLLSITKTLRYFVESTTRCFVAGWCRSPLITLRPPGSVCEKVGQSLERLISVSLIGTLELEHSHSRELLSLPIYKECLGLWSGCLPLLFPSGSLLVKLLSDQIHAYSTSSTDTAASQQSVDLNTLAALPTSLDSELAFRLASVCQRLRIADILDMVIPRPSLFNTDDDAHSHELAGGQDFLSLVSLAKRGGRFGALSQNFRSLYFAVCHRCNTRILLLDGFYAAPETQMRPAGPSNPRSLSTGDTLRISPKPTGELQFDSTKCSDSIALISGISDSSGGNSSVHQRASKVWGAALATNHFNPRTGIHRWAVRLDQCERGHVFLGVATAQASTRTYVGGDKYGWGLIGTQALWHDRRKVSTPQI